MKSRTTVVIPFDERVIFIHSPRCAEFSRRYSEVAQTFDAVSGTQILMSTEWVDKCWLLCTV
ncbi:MAG: hypothetical protein WAU58_03315 [Terriglobales bacterium]